MLANGGSPSLDDIFAHSLYPRRSGKDRTTAAEGISLPRIDAKITVVTAQGQDAPTNARAVTVRLQVEQQNPPQRPLPRTDVIVVQVSPGR